MLESKAFEIKTLGPCRIPSPLAQKLSTESKKINYVADNDKILFDQNINIKAPNSEKENQPVLELAGPRENIYFDPHHSRAAIVTCGGLCPGINDVIRAIVMNLTYRYGVKNIYGIKYGYQGFIPEYGHDVIDLTPKTVSDIHKWGGTVLGTSRGKQDPVKIVDCLERMSINMLFIIGGDGTIRGALKIAEEVENRNLKISVIGIPKTVDNDIMYIDKSFGFETAFAEAVKSITSAHTESLGSYNGVGLVKLMGRHSGFIACYSALAMNDVNYVLIPEVPFKLRGDDGFLQTLKNRLKNRGHAVIVIAEGAGQEYIENNNAKRDASGNIKLGDIGLFLKEEINSYFKEIDMEVNLKYIDPSYIIRSVPASPQDSLFCLRLSQMAVHAAMTGKTELLIGNLHDSLVHIPMQIIATGRKRVDPDSDLWLSVLEATGQPVEFK
ncbi:MAG: ATP-dependent 6-phosphofructokinase [Bacteroidota bacterium]